MRASRQKQILVRVDAERRRQKMPRTCLVLLLARCSKFIYLICDLCFQGTKLVCLAPAGLLVPCEYFTRTLFWFLTDDIMTAMAWPAGQQPALLTSIHVPVHCSTDQLVAIRSENPAQS